jgi:hypothetical protein
MMDRAAESTIDALMYQLRSGLPALEQSSARERISQLNEKQFREVVTRLQKFKPHIARAWTPAQLEMLYRTRSASRAA